LARELERLGVAVDVMVGRSDLRTLLLPVGRSFAGYDIVHSQSSPYGAFVRGVPLVVTVHSPVKVEREHYSLPSRAKSAPAVVMEYVAFGKAKAILAVSETTASDVASRYGVGRERINVIGNGVDYQRFAHDEGKNRRSELILIVSRLEPRKNMGEALRALSELPKGSYAAKIVGDGSQRKELERMAGSLGVNAKFLGRVSDESLPSLYQEAGIFLATSYSEGFGLSLLEAMSAGCAVLASDIPPHRDLIRDGENGFIYADSSDLARKLGILLANDDETIRIGKAAMNTAKEFTWDSVARRVLGVYETCLSRSRN
jgi:glycosyltransferase involved in cell wall biosynthesis